jgi:hypothetical protein
MPPRFDLEPAKNSTLEGKDGQIEGGRYPYGPEKIGRTQAYGDSADAHLLAAIVRTSSARANSPL